MLKNKMMTLAAGLGVAACADSTGLDVVDLQGSWQASQYVFVNDANPNQTVDLITTQGASFVLTVQADGTVSTLFDDGQGGSSSDSGSWTADGSNLMLAGEAFAATRSGDRLTLVDGTEEHDFDNDGSTEPATLRLELQRQ